MEQSEEKQQEEKEERTKTKYKLLCACEDQDCDNILKIGYIEPEKDSDLNPGCFEISINGSNDITRKISSNQIYFKRSTRIPIEQIPKIIQALNNIYLKHQELRKQVKESKIEKLTKEKQLIQN